MIQNRDHFALKFAETEAELAAAQRLRYRVFVTEMGAHPAECGAKEDRERDAFDPYFDHLILKDTRISDDRNNVIGVYRLMRDSVAMQGAGFYSAHEYDLSKIIESGRRSVELGRSCVHVDYRNGLALHMLWQGVANYVIKHDIDVLFGVASFAGTDPKVIADSLSFLHHNHLAPESLQVSALGPTRISLDQKKMAEIDRPKAVRHIPPLIKSYLRLGGFVGEGGFIDKDFNTIDVCLVLDRNLIPGKQLSQLDLRAGA